MPTTDTVAGWSTRPWADPELTSLHRLPMHPSSASTGSARRRRSLNGAWAFRLFGTPDAIDRTAIVGSTARWATTTVPSNWTMTGAVITGGPHAGEPDLPHYTNVQMPFPGPPPRLPDRNPTGVYRRTVSIPTSWRGQQIVVHIGGAESVHAVYVNGHFAGYGTDSRLPSEYDITEWVSPGETIEIAIVVARFSAHSYIEDQDQWWMAGLHREVFIEARPPVQLGSVTCGADLELSSDGGTSMGSLSIRATTIFAGGGDAATRGYAVQVSLLDPDGKPAGASEPLAVPHRFAHPYVFRGHLVEARLAVPDVRPWSAETPNRYRVVVELSNARGTVIDRTEHLVGFRRVEVRERQLLVNGQPVWIFGVNRHDHHPDRGKAVTADDIRADLMAMRRHNITAVRTAHYPNDQALYDLCDELGFYVIDEANIESHGYNTSLCNDARYRSAWLARGSRMVERDRNHPCIIAWSLGNESGYGENHDALAGWMRRADPSRPLHYEGAVFHDGWDHGGAAASDIVCPMYPTIDSIRDYGDRNVGARPLIMCEYSHAMGNSNGSLADYWSVITSTPGLQGGFLWEWKDHGLRQVLPDGTRRLAYGGQFGDSPHDGNFVADGLMSADLEPHPVMAEVHWVYRPVTVELVAARGKRPAQLRVSNRQSFLSLDGLVAEWTLQLDGVAVATGTLDVPGVAPHSSVDIDVPVGASDHGQSGEVHLLVHWTLAADAPWARQGHVVATDQVTLRPAARVRVPRSQPGTVAADPAVLATPVELNIFRAPTDNDGFKLMPDLAERLGVGGLAWMHWQAAGLDHRRAEELVQHRHSASAVDADTTLHHHVVDVPDALADLPRIGVTFSLPRRFAEVRWFGRGPHENYPDRNASAHLGVWSSAIDELPYLVPQEFGLRTDCRWFEVSDPRRGDAVRVDVAGPGVLHCSATRLSAGDLLAAATASEILPGSAKRPVVVCVDAAHRGLGTASCGPDVLDRYRLAPGRYEFAYTLTYRRPPRD